MDGTSSAQLSIDLRTGRPTAIHSGNSCAEQRAACLALNRERSRGILEATQRPASGEPLSVDAWLASVAGQTSRREVPLIPLATLGIRHDEDGMRSSTLLTALKPGAEASPYFDRELGAVYKLFDLRVNGSLGKKIELLPDADGKLEVVLHDAMLPDTLEKLSILNAAGAHPTEIVGLSDTGDYLIVKQPLAPSVGKKYLADRDRAIVNLRGIVPPVTGLRRMVVIIWVDEHPWLVTDLHPGNIMRDQHGAPTIIDALTGPIRQPALRLQWLREAVEDARALREGRPLEVRKRFEDVDDDDL